MPDDPIIFSVVISNLQSVSPTDNASIATPVTSYSPVMFITSCSNAVFDDDHPNIGMKITTVAKTLFSEWWCINDYFGSLLQWSMINLNIAKWLNFVYKFTSQIGHSIFSLLHHSEKSDTTTLSNLADNANLRNTSIVDMTYVVNTNHTITLWFQTI